MPKFSYSYKPEEPFARAMGKELRVSPKHAREVCNFIRGKKLNFVKGYLGEVVEKRKLIPFKRHGKKLAHHRGVQGADAGQYPVKTAKLILEVLKNAEANAEYKGLDLEHLFIAHASAQKGITIRGFTPRAFARATPSYKPLTNVEIVLKERK
jgi:large subunit ribosomal protein L22